MSRTTARLGKEAAEKVGWEPGLGHAVPTRQDDIGSKGLIGLVWDKLSQFPPQRQPVFSRSQLDLPAYLVAVICFAHLTKLLYVVPQRIAFRSG